MIIGHFTYNADMDIYTGAIRIMTVQLGDVRFYPNDEPCRELPFDYWVGAQTRYGYMHFGHAWKANGSSGLPYLDVFLEDPTFAKPLTAQLVPMANSTRAALSWCRPKRRWFEF